MPSLILGVATQFMLPLLLLFSVFLVLRGHNEPGGGFSGGLVAASAFTLYVFAFGVPAGRKAIRVDPHLLLGAGLLIALASGCLALLSGAPLLSGAWHKLELPGLGVFEAGTPVLFDVGVFLVVVGMAMMIVLPLAEDD